MSASKNIETRDVSAGNGLAGKLLGLDGVRVMAVTETDSEIMIDIETAAEVVACATCGARAAAQARMPVATRDLPCFGPPARLVWHERRWRLRDADCVAKIWTETIEHVTPRMVMTRQAGAEACRQHFSRGPLRGCRRWA